MERTDVIQTVCRAALDKKAQDVTVIHTAELTVVADDFIICSGGSKAQVKAISDHIEEKMAEIGIKTEKTDGYNEARWIILDYGSTLVHIFYEEDRAFYHLERLWNNGSNTTVFRED